MNEIVINSMFDYLDVSSIELLGYAVNNISEAIEKESSISSELKQKLEESIYMVREVQEHLYKK